MKRCFAYIAIVIAPLLSRGQDEEPQHHSSPKDRVTVGGSVHVKEDEVVKDVVVVGGSATIEGKVKGECVVVFGKLKLGPKAYISRDLTVVMGSLDADPNATVKGEQNVIMPSDFQVPRGLRWVPQWVHDGLMMGRPLPHQHRWAWVIAGIFLALYLLIAILFPGAIRASMSTLETRPGSSLLTGLLAILLVGPLLVLLLITVIGSILIPFLICGAIAAYFFGKVVVYGYTGRQLGGRRFQTPVVPVLIGTIIFCILYTIPFLGFLVWGVVAPLGIGAVLLAFFSRIKVEKPPPPAPHPLSSPPPPPAFGNETAPAVSAMTAATPPRAGFWLRFLGTLVDVALLLVVFRIFHVRQPLIVVGIWTLYHIALWASAGATIGGFVVGTRIVRTDGSAIELQVAVVRALASFLSAAGLLLGFFWAGWSAQKQAWHDTIAGTYVVKTRPSIQTAPVPAPANQ